MVSINALQRLPFIAAKGSIKSINTNATARAVRPMMYVGTARPADTANIQAGMMALWDLFAQSKSVIPLGSKGAARCFQVMIAMALYPMILCLDIDRFLMMPYGSRLSSGDAYCR